MRQAEVIDFLFDHSCSVYAYEKVKEADGGTAFCSVLKYAGVPCRLMMKAKPGLTTDFHFEEANLCVLFVHADLDVVPGDVFEVTYGKRVLFLSHTADCLVFDTHREIYCKIEKNF